MKILIKQLLVIAVMVFVGVVSTSCNKQEELEPLAQNEAITRSSFRDKYPSL